MRKLALLIPFALAVAGTPARADEFGALPERVAPASEDQSQRPDFRDLLRKAAPVGSAEAAEPPPAASSADAARPAAANAEAGGAPPPRERDARRDIAPKSARPLQRGLAAWYQHTGRTASGQVFNPNGLTAAHRTLPFGTRLRVVSEKTGKSVMVRVTDRISQKALRRHALAIELSRGGARAIGLEGVGVVSVYRARD